MQKGRHSSENEVIYKIFFLASPKAADASGQIESLSHSLLSLGTTDLLDQKNVLGVKEKPVLVGGGTDGAHP